MKEESQRTMQVKVKKNEKNNNRKEGKKEGRSKSNDEVKVWTGNNKRNGRNNKTVLREEKKDMSRGKQKEKDKK